jgi:hypothetical protein
MVTREREVVARLCHLARRTVSNSSVRPSWTSARKRIGTTSPGSSG